MSEMPRQLLVLGRGFGQDAANRAIAAADYYHAHKLERVIFSGGSWLLAAERAPKSEAHYMGAIAIAHGLPDELITLEENSTTTVRNFLENAPLLQEEPTGVVAQNYHLPRGLYMARKTLMAPAIGIPASGEGSRRTHLQERVLLAITRVAFAGVRSGDLEHLKARNERLEQALAMRGLLRKIIR